MVLDYFRQISSIPRGSGFNTGISNFLVDFAKENGFDYYQDEYENVVIYKPASPGYEECQTLIIQGHMDMVCEKKEDCFHDFENEGLELENDDEYIWAKGTTLGADDGVSIAYMLELLMDDTLVSPPLEMVITTDEEVGMLGAKKLDTSVLKGRYMINLDSEEEKSFVVSCSGGAVAHIDIDIKRVPMKGQCIIVEVAELMGGHSGTDIDKNRANANKLLARILSYIPQESFGLQEIGGGSKDNVIPKEAAFTIVVPSEKVDEISDIISEAAVLITDELLAAEPELEVRISYDEDGIVEEEVLDRESYKRVYNALMIIPYGVLNMSPIIGGMVESSENIGIVETHDSSVKIVVSMRSSIKSSIDYMKGVLSSVADTVSGEITFDGEYPGYDMKGDSWFVELLSEVYESTMGHKPIISAIHAGLEIGVFADKIEGLDIISIGPDTYDIHTPGEKLSLKSLDRVEKFLRNAIQAFADNGSKK